MKKNPKRERRSQEERSSTTRAEIVRAAIDCLNEYGYRGATTPVIVERAGLTRGALNHHFGDRNELMLAVCDFAHDERLSFLQFAAKKSDPLEKRIRMLATATWSVRRMPSQRAYLEILVAAKAEPDFLKAVQLRFQRFDHDSEKVWLGAFLDTNVPDELIIGLRDQLFYAVSGMLLCSPFMLDDGYFEQQIELYCEAAILRLQAPARSTRVAARRRSKA